MISAGHVGYVIGKSGESVNLVQQETGARVHIPKGQPGDQIEVVISGNDAQVEAAEARVLALLPSESDTRGPPSAACEDEVLAAVAARVTTELFVQVYIARDNVAMLIGKQGATIKSIQAETGARLSIDHNSEGSEVTYCLT